MFQLKFIFIYIDENVLIIGGGPSARDILFEIATTAKRVTLSHHRDLSKTVFPSNATQKGDVKYLTENGATFTDDTEDNFTTILYCTGKLQNRIAVQMLNF